MNRHVIVVSYLYIDMPTTKKKHSITKALTLNPNTCKKNIYNVLKT